MNKDFTIEYLNSLKMDTIIYINEIKYIKNMSNGIVVYVDEYGQEYDVLNIPTLLDVNKIIIQIKGKLFIVNEYVLDYCKEVDKNVNLLTFLTYKVNECFYCCVSIEDGIKEYKRVSKDIHSARVLELITKDDFVKLDNLLRCNLNNFILRIKSINN